jgi:hypothetical protein
VPISDQQLAANRANAAKSTGPRTPEGKARSAQNARSHGFTASTFAVVRLEDLNEVAHLKADLAALYQPVNSQELFALERMALTQQAMLRAARLESGLFTTCLDAALDGEGRPLVPMNPELVGNGDFSLDIEITRAQNRNYALADGFHRIGRQANSWSLFLRYQAQAERHYRRAVEDFERLKPLRAELPNEAILESQPKETEATYTLPDEPISPLPPPAALHFQPSPEPPVNSGTPEGCAVGAHPPGSASDPAQMAAPVADGETCARRCMRRQAPRAWSGPNAVVGSANPGLRCGRCGAGGFACRPFQSEHTQIAKTLCAILEMCAKILIRSTHT